LLIHRDRKKKSKSEIQKVVAAFTSSEYKNSAEDDDPLPKLPYARSQSPIQVKLNYLFQNTTKWDECTEGQRRQQKRLPYGLLVLFNLPSLPFAGSRSD
jgi:hypothetical protein